MLRIRLLGQLKSAAQTAEILLPLEGSERLQLHETLRKLCDIAGPALSQIIFGEDGRSDPRERVVILKNERDVGVLNGLTTLVEDDDELTLIPIAHGG